jgi:hypothetical protein
MAAQLATSQEGLSSVSKQDKILSGLSRVRWVGHAACIGGISNAIKFWLGNLQVTHHLGDLDIVRTV